MLENSTSSENPGTGDPVSVGSGQRWPRKETYALLDIRSSLDAKFRDSSSKAHLWEEVSGKMGELGFSRSAKKCKEKFENIYKYHRRTKDVRSEKANGKAYHFFDQLEALDHQQQPQHAVQIQVQANSDVILDAVPCSIHKPTIGNSSPSASYSSSSSQESEGTRRKKTKLTHFFERLMKEIAERQECLQRTFVEALEKCERDRIAREESWKAQELERTRRETELLIRERSATAEKDAALLELLKRLAEQRSDDLHFPETRIRDLRNELGKFETKTCLDKQEKGSVQIVGSSSLSSSSSRWPKEEVDALIRIRTNLDAQYLDNGSKGPLWEEVSSSMAKLGYDRSSKRCKEKWENINKYFKKVRKGNKKRGFDSKTCPYFHQLDALYSNNGGSNKKAKKTMDSGDDDDDDDEDNNDNGDENDDDMRPEELLMHMMTGHEERERVDHEKVGDGGDGSFEV